MQITVTATPMPMELNPTQVLDPKTICVAALALALGPPCRGGSWEIQSTSAGSTAAGIVIGVASTVALTGAAAVAMLLVDVVDEFLANRRLQQLILDPIRHLVALLVGVGLSDRPHLYRRRRPRLLNSSRVSSFQRTQTVRARRLLTQQRLRRCKLCYENITCTTYPRTLCVDHSATTTLS